MTLAKKNPLATIAGLVVTAVLAVVLIGSFTSPMSALEPTDDAAAFVPVPEATPTPVPGTVPIPEATAAPTPGTVPEAATDDAPLSAAFEGVGPYDLNGLAEVVTGDNGERILRLTDDFSTPFGPGLYIYLRADNGDFVSLGALENLEGPQEYEIPADLDLSVFNEVQVWCEPFGINFGSAFLGS